ncbi:MAG: AMP-binding protein, partial [Angustibacter sp.]
MSEVTVPALVSPPTTGNIANFLDEHADKTPDRVLLSRHTELGWADVTAADFRQSVHAVGRGLMAAGVNAGDRVFLLSATRYEWTLIDFAIWSIGAVTVPIYETSSPAQISWILQDSRAKVGFVETLAHAAAIEQAGGVDCQT